MGKNDELTYEEVLAKHVPPKSHLQQHADIVLGRVPIPKIGELKTGKRDSTVILISGYKRSGKDFVSHLLDKRFGDSVVYSYATPLKKIIADTMSISLKELDDYKNDTEILYTANSDIGVGCIGMKLPVTDFRTILQNFGTEAMKPWFGNAVWSDVFMRQNFPNEYIIIPDWRFNIEYEEAKKMYRNVITLRINDDNIVNTDLHPSEAELEGFNFDYTIDNTRKDNTVLIEIDKFLREI